MTFDQLQQFVQEDRMTSTDALLSLHDVRERGVSVHWDEAVAIVEEMCDVAIASSGDEAPVPALGDVLMSSAGGITLRRTRGDESPTAAGRVLHGLLTDGDVPMPLRLFVTQSIAQGTHSSLRQFARGLAYFGKPSRQPLIQEVYARCAQTPRAADARPVQPPPPMPTRENELAQTSRVQQPSTRRRVIRVALAAAVLGLTVSAAWIWKIGGLDQGVQGSAERILSEATAVLADLGKQVRDTLSPTAAAPEVSAADASVTSGGTRRTRRGSSASAGDSQPAPLRSRPVSMPKSGGALHLAMTVPNAVASEPPVAYEQPTAPEPGPVYSSADGDVDPPALLFPQLIPPVAGPEAASSVMNRMVVVVSPEGTVERVQLVEGPARLPDMMLLSGAKTWRFTPAFKDGEPVRYRTVISWAALP